MRGITDGEKELLDALQLMLDRFGSSDEDDQDLEAIEAARAAIDKATGK